MTNRVRVLVVEDDVGVALMRWHSAEAVARSRPLSHVTVGVSAA